MFFVHCPGLIPPRQQLGGHALQCQVAHDYILLHAINCSLHKLIHFSLKASRFPTERKAVNSFQFLNQHKPKVQMSIVPSSSFTYIVVKVFESLVHTQVYMGICNMASCFRRKHSMQDVLLHENCGRLETYVVLRGMIMRLWDLYSLPPQKQGSDYMDDTTVCYSDLNNMYI